MRHLIARYGDYYVVGLKDRAYLVFDTPDHDARTGKIITLLPSSGLQVMKQSVIPPSIVRKGSDLPSSAGPCKLNKDSSNKDEGRNPKDDADKVLDLQKSDEQLNEICAVGIIGDTDKTAERSSPITVLRCAVARSSKALDIYTVNLENLPNSTSTSIPIQKTSQSPSLHYRTPKRLNCFTFASIDIVNGKSSIPNTKTPLLISGDVAGDSYAYNLLEKGQRLLLGHTASILTDISIFNGEKSQQNSHLLLTSDRDEKIRISRFPETHIIEGFLLGHTAYVTGFTVIESASSALVVSCGGDMIIRLWDLRNQRELSSISTANSNSTLTTDEGPSIENTIDRNEIPTAIAASSCGRIVAVIFDNSRRLSIFEIVPANDEDKQSLQLLGSVDCPSQPLSITFHEVQETESLTKAGDSGTVLTVLLKEPDYVIFYSISCNNQEVAKPIAFPGNEIRGLQSLRDVASNVKIAMPNTILEKDEYGNPVLQKENETRGPASADAPWNRIERIGVAKEREKRRKKKPKLTNST